MRRCSDVEMLIVRSAWLQVGCICGGVGGFDSVAALFCLAGLGLVPCTPPESNSGDCSP